MKKQIVIILTFNFDLVKIPYIDIWKLLLQLTFLEREKPISLEKYFLNALSLQCSKFKCRTVCKNTKNKYLLSKRILLNGPNR